MKIYSHYTRYRLYLINKYKKFYLNWALKNPRYASFYYWIFSRQFDREHYSVLYGKMLNIKADTNSLAIDATLRRYLHMIEKGLIHPDQKPVFAEKYIINTVEVLQKQISYKKNLHLQKWAYDVLSEYFRKVDKTTTIQKAEDIFKNILINNPLESNELKKFIPYQRNVNESLKFKYNDFLTLCKQRHSIRQYENKEVPIDLVKNAIEVALTAPSACNRQAMRFIIIQNKEKLSKTVNLPIGCNTFSDNIKLMVLLIGDLSAYFDERDRHLIYIDGGLASMSFMLALETLGLSSCPINWPDIEDKEETAAKEFNLKPHEKGIIFFSIGYPLNSGLIAYSARKNVEDVLTVY